MYFSPLSCYPVPLRPKYSQHPVLKHPQPMFLPQCQRPSFTSIQNNRQNYSSKYYIHPLNFICGYFIQNNIITSFEVVNELHACIVIHKFKENFISRALQSIMRKGRTPFPSSLDKKSDRVVLVCKNQRSSTVRHSQFYCVRRTCQSSIRTQYIRDDSTDTKLRQCKNSHVPHNDVSVDGPHIRRRSHKIINTYYCVTLSYSIQFNNLLYTAVV